MEKIILIAWRNVWRNKLRSFVVILSMILGLWAGLFTVSMTIGLSDQRVKSAINTYLPHIQIHNPSFEYNFDVNSTIKNPNYILSQIKKNPKVKAFSSRVVLSGMASSAHGSEGVKIMGIDPQKEILVSDINQNIIKGSYFSKVKSKPIVIGQKLAENLKLDLKKKLSITFVDDNGGLQRIKFKVEGIFKTASSIHDGANVYVKKKDLIMLFENKYAIHEIVVMSNEINESNILKDSFTELFPKTKVETWAEVSPELGMVSEVMIWFFYIFIGIILVALSFGIANTMLMAVLERKNELGMLMSIGLNKSRIFLMIMFETLFISLVSVPIGIVLSYLMISYFGEIGIDLSIVGKGLESFGIKTRLYTNLPFDYYYIVTILTLFVTFLSSLFPARRALKLDPAEAVRSI